MALTSPGVIETLAISSISSYFVPYGVWVAAKHAWALVSWSGGARGRSFLFLSRQRWQNLIDVETNATSHPLGLKPISSKFQNWDGRGWISFRSSGTFFGSKGIVGSWIEILGLIGDKNDALFEFRLAQRFRISSISYSLYCSLISIYIWDILWNIFHARRGSLCLALLLPMLETLTNTVLLFFFYYNGHLLYDLISWLLSGYTCMLNCLLYPWLIVMCWPLLWKVVVCVLMY